AGAETIADAADGLDAGRPAAKLLAQKPDDSIHDIAAALVIDSPDRIQQGCTADRGPRAFGQQPHDVEFQWRERDALLAQHQLARLDIEQPLVFETSLHKSEFLGHQTGEPAIDGLWTEVQHRGVIGLAI